MPDTIRSISELNSMLADNSSGFITAQDIRDLMVSQMVHAEIGTLGQASKTLGNGWEVLDFDKKGAFERGIVANTGEKMLSGIPVDMKAIVSLEVYFKGESGQDYDFTVFKIPDGTGTPQNIARLERDDHRIVNAAQTYHLSYSVGVSFDQNDAIKAAVRSTSGNNFELLGGILRFQRIGVE